MQKNQKIKADDLSPKIQIPPARDASRAQMELILMINRLCIFRVLHFCIALHAHPHLNFLTAKSLMPDLRFNSED
jgi:hypothetical protein